MHLERFARALHLRWPWLEGTAPEKTWVGMGNPCDKVDMELFHTATTITIGDGQKAPFWESAWLHGLRPKDVAPLIYTISKKKNCRVYRAIE